MRGGDSTTQHIHNINSYMNKSYILILLSMLFATSAVAQPAYSPDIQKESLDRGLVCLKDGDSIIVSWRLLNNEEHLAFNISANGKQLNDKPISSSTFFKALAPEKEAKIRLTAIDTRKNKRVSSCFTLYQPQQTDYLTIPLTPPMPGVAPDGKAYIYSANDASVGDVDGDGAYEVILKWDPSNSHDNSHEGYTGPVYIDCYKLTGQRLWRINLGRNIRAGAHYTQFLVYDFDGDGRSELIVKTADGTRDGSGQVIGDPQANWVTDEYIIKHVPGKSKPQTSHNFGRILKGPEYLTVFEGKTGKALATVPFEPARGEVADWGDTYGNRCDRFLAAVAYLDGKHPSAIMCRGYYGKTCLAAYDWDGHNLTLRWLFNSLEHPGYSGQGNHNLRVGDVDGDGCDEITFGAMATDNDGSGLYTTRLGHGDAIHQFAFYPDSTQLQIWDVHENKVDGSELRDARTGRIIFQIPSDKDVGRGMAADIDPTNWGLEMWSSSQRGYFDVKGQHHYPKKALPQNSAVWWNGDLLRELLDRNAVLKWNWQTQAIDTLKNFRSEGCNFNNGSKQNPCLSADIIGDWREEVIVRDRQSTQLRIYSTTIPTSYRFPTFMLDIPYRLSVAAENVGYNQPPEPGFYFGSDLPIKPQEQE